MYGHNVDRRGIRAWFLALAPVCTLLSATPAVAQEEPDPEEAALLAAMISLVTAHDIAILVGTLPFPVTSIVGESTEFAANVALKALPPRLFAPANRSVDPTGPDGPGYSTDGCGIEFKLLKPVGGYANMFGILPLRDPYTQLNPFRIYTWRNRSDPDDVNAETRWGFLRAPSVYHANSDVEVEIVTPYQLRKYNQQTGLFDPPYTPIDTFADSPQDVYLPIGRHPIEWHGTTQLNLLSDIAIPAGLLTFNVLSGRKPASARKSPMKRSIPTVRSISARAFSSSTTPGRRHSRIGSRVRRRRSRRKPRRSCARNSAKRSPRSSGRPRRTPWNICATPG